MASLNADQALAELLSGNLRYISQQPSRARRDSERRVETAVRQSPLAVVLGCADSRVPPEIIFDQGLGDLYVVRSAAQVVGSVGMGTIEYAVKRLAVPLLLVLGHSKCGAVAAAVEGHVPQGRLQRLLQPMAPLVTEAKARGGDVLDHAVRANVRRVVQSLCNEDSLSVLVKGGMLKIAGAHYDLETGVVTLVP